MADYSRLVREAWDELYPDDHLRWDVSLKYSGQFKGFNANIRLYANVLTVKMSKNWRRVDKQIQKGLIQELLVKLTKKKARHTNMHLYRIFLKHAHIGVPKTKTHPILESSFNRVNEEYFGGTIDRPNLVWSDGMRRVGYYDYGADAIAISKVLVKDLRLLDYVMYHEMLHKKHKFSAAKSRSIHHSRAFKQDEARFKDAVVLERQLQGVSCRGRWKRLFGL